MQNLVFEAKTNVYSTHIYSAVPEVYQPFLHSHWLNDCNWSKAVKSRWFCPETFCQPAIYIRYRVSVKFVDSTSNILTKCQSLRTRYQSKRVTRRHTNNRQSISHQLKAIPIHWLLKSTPKNIFPFRMQINLHAKSIRENECFWFKAIENIPAPIQLHVFL